MTWTMVSSGGLDAELEADWRRPDLDSTPVRSIGSTSMVGVRADTKVDVEVDLELFAGTSADYDPKAGTGRGGQAVGATGIRTTDLGPQVMSTAEPSTSSQLASPGTPQH